MPQNTIQFQRGLSLSTFIERYGSEAACESALLHARWPNGFRCPECGGRAHSTFLVDARRYWQCSHCREQTTGRSKGMDHPSRPAGRQPQPRVTHTDRERAPKGGCAKLSRLLAERWR